MKSNFDRLKSVKVEIFKFKLNNTSQNLIVKLFKAFSYIISRVL